MKRHNPVKHGHISGWGLIPISTALSMCAYSTQFYPNDPLPTLPSAGQE